MKKDKLELISEGYKNHFGKPKTRRELLGQGMIAGAASVWMPSVLSIASQKAYGLDGEKCESGSGDSLAGTLRVVNVELDGGAGLAGKNLMVGGSGGQQDRLSNYSSLGQPGGQITTESIAGDQNGLLFANNSPMLDGIRSKLAEANRSFVNGFVICGTSNDDTGNNLFDPSYLYAELGQYALVPSIGRLKSRSVDENPAKATIRVEGPGDAMRLAKVGTLGEVLGVDGAKKVLKGLARLSEVQLTAFKQQTLPAQIKTLVECGYLQAPDQLGKYTEETLNPANDPIMNSVFNLGDGNESRAATVALLVLRGMAGVGTIQLGGYDYHNAGIGTQNARDREAGVVIGGVMEAAVRLGVMTQINVWSDGSVGYDGQGAPVGDRGTKGLGVSFIVTPGKAPIVTRTQIGAYSNDGSVDTSVGPWSQSSAEQARAMFYNGLLALGRGEELTKFSRLPLIITALEETTAFGKMVG